MVTWNDARHDVEITFQAYFQVLIKTGLEIYRGKLTLKRSWRCYCQIPDSSRCDEMFSNEVCS